MASSISPHSIVAGRPATAGHETLKPLNPATGTALAPVFIEATRDELDAAMRAADEASLALRGVSNEQVATFLDGIADRILDLGDALIQRCADETALPTARLQGERGRTMGQLKMFAQLRREGSYVDARIDHADPDRAPLPKPDVRCMLVPLGPVAIFGASNFPLAFSVAGGDTASAFAAGCPVVFKAHHAHMGTAALVGTAVVNAAREAHMPEGIFSLLHGRGRTVGDALVRHPVTRAVTFTGSKAGGRTLFDAAASRPDPIPVFAEMGSVNPIFVLPEAMAERGETIASGFAQSVTLGVGQFCTNPGLMFCVEDNTTDAFVQRVQEQMDEAVPATMLTGQICAAYRKGLATLAAIPGVETATAPSVDGNRATAAVLETRGETFLADPRLAEEVFGPSTLIVRCTSVEQMAQIARGIEGQLTATVHGTEAELLAGDGLVALLERKAGRLLFNGFPTGVEVCHAMHHGGPYPATTDARFTSVGSASILRFLRPIAYQNFPQAKLPEALRDTNPQGLWRLVDGQRTTDGH